MGVLGIILLVIFCIIAVLLIFLVAIQDENSVGLGGIFGGNSDSAFGSQTASFITKATTTLAIIFMVLSLVVAFLNKSSAEDLTKMVSAQTQTESSSGTTWLDDSSSAETAAPAAEATN